LIDTGFNGGLCLPRNVFEELGLEVEDEVPFSGIGGHQAMADVAVAEIVWLDKDLEVSVLVNDGQDFLLGTQLLAGKELYINYKTDVVLITEL
jgi:clan AA aspartic protease